jgi:hypothetical protein
MNDPDADSGEPATVRHTAAPDADGENTDADPQCDRENPTPEEEGYGYGV